jgi:iron complex transport system substrate-binding protein
MVTKTIILSLLILLVGVGIGYSAYLLSPPKEIHVTTTQYATVTETKPVYSTVTQSIMIYSTATETRILSYTLTTRPEWPRVLTDALGRRVEIPRPPERIVSTIPSITEDLVALGLLNKIVGVDSYSNYPPVINDLKKNGSVADIGGPWTLDIEKIINLRPDIVFMCRGVKPQETQFAPKLEERGVRTFFLICDAAKDQYDVYTDLRLIAQVTGRENYVDSVIESIQRTINNVTTTLAKYNLTRPKVLLLLGPPSWGLWSAGGDTFINWVISTAGGVNIASRYSGWPQLDKEYVLSQNPDIIIITVHGLDPKNIIDEVLKDPVLKETKAAKNNKIFVVSGETGDALLRPGPRIGFAVEAVAKILYPNIFGPLTSRDIYSLSTYSYVLSIAR